MNKKRVHRSVKKSLLIKPSGVNKHVLFKIEGTNRNSDELFIIPKMSSVVG